MHTMSSFADCVRRTELYSAHTHHTAHSIATMLNGLDELNLFNTKETELKVSHSVVSGPTLKKTLECDAHIMSCRVVSCVCLHVILEDVKKQIQIVNERLHGVGQALKPLCERTSVCVRMA